MANRQNECKGQNSESSCTCESINDCQDDSNAQTLERNNIKINECSSDCINCKLLNRLYILLEEIVENRKSTKNTEDTKNSKYDGNPIKIIKKDENKVKNINTGTSKTKDKKKERIFNVYNNNTGTNNVTLCDCDKTDNACHCHDIKEQTSSQGVQTFENINRGSAQYWHSVGKLKNQQEQVDFGCQCNSSKKDSSTQDYSTQNEAKTKNKNKKDDSQNDTNSSLNTEALNIYSTLLNDPKFRDAMKLMPCPNIVVLSNGCNCCSKCNTPLERTSVTTNTSDILVPAHDKNEVYNRLHEFGKISLDATQIYQDKSAPRESIVTFPENMVMVREPSLNNKDFISNVNKPRESSSTRTSLKNSIKNSSKKDNNNDLFEDTTFMVPQETDFTVAAALVSKSGGKKKTTPKSKKRKSKISDSSNDKKSLVNSCCQTDSNLIKEPVITKTDVGMCCDKTKCNAFTQKFAENEYVKKVPSQNSCNCKDVQNFVAIITELCAQMNKKSGEMVECECNSKKATTKRQSVFPDSNKEDCLEIQRLAEKIVEIQLKSNRNKSSSRMSKMEPVRTTTSDCDLNNCIHLNPAPAAHSSDSTEECYCRQCPCKKTLRSDRRDMYPVKKEKRGRSTINPPVKRATKRLTEQELANLNKWTQQFPPLLPQDNLVDRQKCTCSNFECMEETEIGCLNYNISDYSKEQDNCQMETCPQLRRIVKDCLCGTKNCYCHNAKLNELKTTAKLERLADEVISTITPCNCMGQQCTCDADNNNNNNVMDPGFRKCVARQVCFSTIYHENQQKISDDAVKAKKLFDKDVNGNPCLNGSKSETKLYLKNILTTKPKNKPGPLKKVIQSAKELKPLVMKPLLPIPETVSPQINYIHSLFPEIYKVLKKIKELTNWDFLPQEIVEIVIDKILKREIKCALQQMKEGVVKVNTNGSSGDNKKNTNILNILLEEKSNPEETIKEFKNNIFCKQSEPSKQTLPEEETNCKKIHQQTINLVNDSDNNIKPNVETLDIHQKDFDLNKKPILVQINIEKGGKSSPKKKNKIPVVHSFVPENVSSSSIYITQNKLGSIKDLIIANNENNQELEDDETASSTTLSIKQPNQPISININIEMDAERNLRLKDMNAVEDMNVVEEKTPESATPSLSKETITESTEKKSSKELKTSSLDLDKLQKLMYDLQEKNKSMEDLLEKRMSMDDDLQEKRISNVNVADTRLLYHRKKSEMPLLEDFLAMNKNMKVQKIKIAPKNINKH